jgi:hypothetical protein
MRAAPCDARIRGLGVGGGAALGHPRRGQIDMTHFSGISQDSYPCKTGPGRHCSQPKTKISDRVKLSECLLIDTHL